MANKITRNAGMECGLKLWCIEVNVSANQIGREHGAGAALVTDWGKYYLEDGEEAPEPGNGNPYGTLHRSKSLSEIERLLVAKQEVEIARLRRSEWFFCE